MKITLIMPYIPHARQDRNVSDRLFTLKYFAKFINDLNFHEVIVMDPHSEVSTALIDRVRVENLWFTRHDIMIEDYLKDKIDGRKYQIMYPDAGAAKKYGATPDCVVGVKHRNKEGRIDGYEFSGLNPETKCVVIIDDICSYGGTFVSAALALKAAGVESVYLIVTHAENHIIDGDVLKVLDYVITSDDICEVKEPRYFEDGDYENLDEIKEKLKHLKVLNHFRV